MKTATNLPNSICLKIDAAQLRADPMQAVIDNIMTRPELQDHKENLYVILAELIINALDYGILGLAPSIKDDPEGLGQYFLARMAALASLEQGWIAIDLNYSPLPSGGKIIIRMQDSGPGFDYTKIKPNLCERHTCRGRGIYLVRSLCQSLTFQGKGNIVEAVYQW